MPLKAHIYTRNDHKFVFLSGDYLRHQLEILDQLDAEDLGLVDA